ncbi:MAG: CHASE2 domain-containing protein [Gammaproteobacteria bacterium]
MSTRARQVLVNALINTSIAVVAAALLMAGALDGLERPTLDLRFKLRGEVEVDPRVVIVAVDEPSLRVFGQFPWSRRLHAELVERLNAAGARVIAFDMLFTEGDRLGKIHDQDLARSMQVAGNVVLGMFFERMRDDETFILPLWPLPELAQAARLGHVNLTPDPDGVLRVVPLYVYNESQRVPSLAVAALQIYHDEDIDGVLARLAPGPSRPSRLVVNFAGGRDQFERHSYARVILGHVDAERFKDKIVLVGGTASALFDATPVPNAPVFHGVEIHASMINTILMGNQLRHVHPAWTAVVMLVIAVVGSLALTGMNPWISALAALLTLLAYAGIAQLVFTRANLVAHVVPVLAGVTLMYGATLLARLLSEYRERRWIHATFGQYLSPKVISMLESQKDEAVIGADQRVMTVLFSDVVGFTSLSEQLEPKALVSLLNDYLSEMSSIVLRHDGVIDKFMGDGLMAFWNAPFDQPDHAARACRTALEQLRRLDRMREQWVAGGLPAVNVRIGIHTGRMTVGNLGSRERFDYTVVGDAVNLASRLEGLNNEFGTRCIISESTLTHAGSGMAVRELDLVTVRGRREPVRVYELLGVDDAGSRDTPGQPDAEAAA